MKELTLLGTNLALHIAQTATGWKSMLLTRQLTPILDTLRQENPSYSKQELADLLTDLLTEQYPELDQAKVYWHPKTQQLCGFVSASERIVPDPATKTLNVTHIGYTIRSLQAAAANSDPTIRRWRINLDPSKIHLGEILLRRISENK